MPYLNENSHKKIRIAIGSALVVWGCLHFVPHRFALGFIDPFGGDLQHVVAYAAIYVVPIAAIYAGIRIASGSAGSPCLIICSFGIFYSLLAVLAVLAVLTGNTTYQIGQQFDSPLIVILAVGNIVTFPVAFLYLVFQSRTRIFVIKHLVIILFWLGVLFFLFEQSADRSSTVLAGLMGILNYVLWQYWHARRAHAAMSDSKVGDVHTERNDLDASLKSDYGSLASVKQRALSDPESG